MVEQLPKDDPRTRCMIYANPTTADEADIAEAEKIIKEGEFGNE